MESWESSAVRYRFKIDHARQVERVLQWLGEMMGPSDRPDRTTVRSARAAGQPARPLDRKAAGR
jgi:hypothetical protein